MACVHHYTLTDEIRVERSRNLETLDEWRGVRFGFIKVKMDPQITPTKQTDCPLVDIANSPSPNNSPEAKRGKVETNSTVRQKSRSPATSSSNAGMRKGFVGSMLEAGQILYETVSSACSSDAVRSDPPSRMPDGLTECSFVVQMDDSTTRSDLSVDSYGKWSHDRSVNELLVVIRKGRVSSVSVPFRHRCSPP